jgi:hypothetical protein
VGLETFAHQRHRGPEYLDTLDFRIQAVFQLG